MDGWLTAVLAWAITALLRAIGATWRFESRGHNPLEDPLLAGQPQLGVFWHRNIIAGTWCYRGSGFGVSVSRSRDGDLISRVLRRLGYAEPARGSSSRGGAASLRSLVRTVRAGTTIAMLADGPRGPARRSKVGVVVLAQLTGAPIVPVAFSCSSAWVFDSWDRTLLPRPFAKVVCAYGDPIHVPPETTDEAEICREVDEALNRLTDAVDETCGYEDPRRPIPTQPSAKD